jgi:hypothetical protein
VDFTDWDEASPDRPDLVQHPTTRDEWLVALDRYLHARNDLPLLRCLDVVLTRGATTLVIERRYLDIDYRSEYSTYFSRLFESVPDTTHRLHFFTGHVTREHLGLINEGHGYLGYVVVRPTEKGPISRAMLRPPLDIEDSIRASVTERVSFFGEYLEVTGVPFTQQDTQLGACAHAAAWICHFTASLRGDVTRRPRAEFINMVNSSLSLDRAIPTSGLNVGQLSDLFRSTGLPSIFYALGRLPTERLPWQPSSPTDPGPLPDGTRPPPGTWDHGVVPILTRYLNSGYPVLVGTQDHAFVVCGYRRSPTRSGWIDFYRNDDQRGPYMLIENVLQDKEQTPWSTLHVPLPEKIWLGPEAAERIGGLALVATSSGIRDQLQTLYGGPIESLRDLIDHNTLALKTYVTRSNEFKARLIERRIPEGMVRAYRLAGLSRFVWVVEAVDRDLRAAGEPCVLGQAIFDSTSDDTVPNLIGLDVHGVVWPLLNGGAPRLTPTGPYLSGAVGPP